MPTITLSANTSWYLYNFRASTVRALIDKGYRVVCLSPKDSYSQKLIHELGCEWLPLRMDNKGSSPLAELALVFQFMRYYRRLRPAVALHFTIKNNLYGTWAARVNGVPAINTISGLGTAFIRAGLTSTVVRLLYRLSQPFAHRIFCQNAEDQELLVARGLVKRERLILIPGSGVDLQRFHPRLRSAHTGPLRFLFAGRMLTDKGLLELQASIAELNRETVRCELWLAGFADAHNVSALSPAQLGSWGEEPGVRWLGPSDVMEEVYAKVDCVVLPSYREGMPRSLLEAGAMGLPVVATNVAGCRNIIEHGVNGLLCEVRNVTSLTQALERMLQMSDAQRITMGNNARELVANQFDERLVVDATIAAVESALESVS